jgi:hypothetical protein
MPAKRLLQRANKISKQRAYQTLIPSHQDQLARHNLL